MVTTTGKFDGKQVILDTIPEGLVANTRVRITILPETELTGLAAIAAMAGPGGLPPDFAAQHEHYTHGTPKK